jgi:hypothetical protein
MTLLLFPRLARDPDYLYGRLKPLLPSIDAHTFRRAFEAVSRPELIHDFDPGDRSSAPRIEL